MSEVIERVARAIVERRHGKGAMVYGENLADARAAIEAMREPTKAMERVGAREAALLDPATHNAETTAYSVWFFMIDIALKHAS